MNCRCTHLNEEILTLFDGDHNLGTFHVFGLPWILNAHKLLLERFLTINTIKQFRQLNKLFDIEWQQIDEGLQFSLTDET